MKHDDTHINEKVVAIKDIARLVYLVEHRASFTDFKAFLLKEKLASYEDGVLQERDTQRRKVLRTFCAPDVP